MIDFLFPIVVAFLFGVSVVIGIVVGILFVAGVVFGIIEGICWLTRGAAPRGKRAVMPWREFL